MDELQALRAFADERKKECAIQALAFSIQLSKLLPANVVLVVGSAALAAVAGSALLAEREWLSKDVLAILALTSSLFTIIHSKFDCDNHQAECRRLRALYGGLSKAYESLQVVSNVEDLKARLLALSNERVQIEKSSFVSPWRGCLKKARSIVEEAGVKTTAAKV